MDHRLLNDFARASGTEMGVVDGASQILWEYFELGEQYSWIAVKHQIEEAQAQKYRGLQKGEVALRWLQAAKEGRLTIRRDPMRGIVISEA